MLVGFVADPAFSIAESYQLSRILVESASTDSTAKFDRSGRKIASRISSLPY